MSMRCWRQSWVWMTENEQRIIFAYNMLRSIIATSCENTVGRLC